ncbi:hypothetical protein OJAV_G00049730 [Oryzias javanicus]|uniref:A-kinase anchor protein 2 C-terminal domain-containing protein n=1 Tax=Oryzias javanicus TaxID=123683 RepID=A0A437DFF6_ORYJA|nr:hypothetical protein OJAV_G00049730 [Oryzias javanicus]
MASTPKRWTLKPLSPVLRPSDLQTMTVSASDLNDSSNSSVVDFSSRRGSFQDALVQTSPVHSLLNGSTDESDQLDRSSPSSWRSPSSPSSPRCGFYSFVEDPMSPEAKQNESWMVSSQRQAYLATLKEETGFKLQAYNRTKKPQTLFSVDQDDSQYKIDPSNDVNVICATEEKQLRKEIIRSQAPRKMVAQTSRCEVNLTRSTNTETEPYSPVSSRTKPPQPSQPETTKKYQSNFKTIRKLFLNMEEEQLKALFSPVWCTKLRRVSTLQSRTNVTLPHEDEVQRTEKMCHTTDDLERNRELTSKPKDCARNAGLFQQDNTTHQFFSLYESPTEEEIRTPEEHEENLENSSGGEVTEATVKPSLSLLSSGTSKETLPDGIYQKQEIHLQNLETKDPQLHESPGQVRPFRTNADDIRTEEKPQMGSGTGDVFPSPCCPHRHPQESKFYQTNVASSSRSEGDADVQNSPRFQEDPDTCSLPSPRFSPFSSRESPRWEPQNLDYASSQSRGPAPLDLIKKEIQEVLKREQELKEMRESRKAIGRPLLSPASLVEQANMMAVRLFYPQPNKEKEVNLASCSGRVTSSSSDAPRTPSSRVLQRPPSLTEIPVPDSEEHQAKLKLEESSYGGILLVDNINNKVIESTRVVRHKNQRALRWEAGVFTNTDT